jgi:hypothetical protein
LLGAGAASFDVSCAQAPGAHTVRARARPRIDVFNMGGFLLSPC